MVEVMAQAAARYLVEGADVLEKEGVWRTAEKAAAQAQIMQIEAEKAEKLVAMLNILTLKKNKEATANGAGGRKVKTTAALQAAEGFG